MTIARSLNLNRGRMGGTKSGAPRAVPLGAGVTARMREYLLAAGRPENGAPVFPSFDRGGSWGRVRASAGLSKPLPPLHDLRHTTATLWLASGLTVHAVAELAHRPR